MILMCTKVQAPVEIIILDHTGFCFYSTNIAFTNPFYNYIFIKSKNYNHVSIKYSGMGTCSVEDLGPQLCQCIYTGLKLPDLSGSGLHQL